MPKWETHGEFQCSFQSIILTIFIGYDALFFTLFTYTYDAFVAINAIWYSYWLLDYLKDSPRPGRSGVRIPVGSEFIRNRPDRPWGPPSLLYNGYRVFPGGKAAGVWPWIPTSSSAEAEGRVELYICSSSGPSYPVLGRTSPVHLYLIILFQMSLCIAINWRWHQRMMFCYII